VDEDDVRICWPLDWAVELAVYDAEEVDVCDELPNKSEKLKRNNQLKNYHHKQILKENKKKSWEEFELNSQRGYLRFAFNNISFYFHDRNA